MSERVNIAQLAEIVSEDIFSKFGWEMYGPPNESWVCTEPTAHKAKDHPTDVTFVYEDPYSAANIHLITDLKSYAAGSIADYPLKEAIESLAKTVACAKTNKNWKDLYLKEGAEWEVHGLLFVYNHDSSYDKIFPKQLNSVFQQKVEIPSGVKLYILGPDDIWYINEILVDLAQLIYNEKITSDKKSLSFFYRSESRTRLARPQAGLLATIDLLRGKHQIIRYVGNGRKGGEKEQGCLVYYRGKGVDVKEFILLIDMLRSYSLLDTVDSIQIRCPRAVDIAAVNFKKAVSQYAEHPVHKDLEILQKISFSSVASVRPNISRFEAALKD
jgi:hypothetical protein